jgi:hypothetical protein
MAIYNERSLAGYVAILMKNVFGRYPVPNPLEEGLLTVGGEPLSEEQKRGLLSYVNEQQLQDMPFI